MRPATARALVLDFGGVMSKTLFETHDASEAALGLAPGTLTWRGPFDLQSDPLWAAMQRGEISERDYWLARSREVGAMIGEEWSDMEQFVRRARGSDPLTVIRPEAEQATRAVNTAGFKLAILSNELDLFYGASFRHRLPLLERFDAIVDATYTKILKPDLRAYQAVLDRLSLATESCVFVDDQNRNVAGAQACGFKTVHFDVREPRRCFNEALRYFDLELE